MGLVSGHVLGHVLAEDRIELASGDLRRPLSGLELPLRLDLMMPEGSPWELELGFGKGRYLLGRAAAEPGTGFLGIEVARPYYRIAARRASRRGLANLHLLAGDARYVLAVVLPARFARAVHVYFPDPWPKLRHHKRRFLDPQSIDLVLDKLLPDGTFSFATDHADLGAAVAELLRRHPGLEVSERSTVWDGGPRTNYERKYVDEGRPILRLEARWADPRAPRELHPDGATAILVAPNVGGQVL